MALSIPKTHKAAMFKEKGGPIVIEEIETRDPQEGEVLVKVLACGVCHSEMVVQQATFGTPFPRIPGHEIIGIVVALGPGEKTWKVGDRVGGPWHGGHCGHCKQCKRGFNQTCVEEQINGVTRDGGFAEYCILRTEATVGIPSDVDPAAFAPLLCAGVTVFNSMRQMNITSGETVAIQGLGGLGHLAVQYANKMGFKVVALSSSGAKEKFAKDLGAHVYIDGSKENHAEALRNMGGAAMIVSTAPNPGIMGELINGLAPMGKLILLSPMGEIKINTQPMIVKGTSVHGWPSGQALDCEEAVDFAQLHNVNCMIEKFPLEKANEAYDHMMSGKVRFRSVLVMS
ncbi:hypothetical protein ABVK25_010327 [Lepraria finkii]|uniref:Enoyl reductase (ER) domain-containing protein n=1 Tax=Lepraria finkii TaxID=1340010 RepID=A0ABR4AUQ4_9LECA